MIIVLFTPAISQIGASCLVQQLILKHNESLLLKIYDPSYAFRQEKKSCCHTMYTNYI